MLCDKLVKMEAKKYLIKQHISFKNGNMTYSATIPDDLSLDSSIEFCSWIASELANQLFQYFIETKLKGAENVGSGEEECPFK